MPTLPQEDTVLQFVGDGTTTVFNFTFYIPTVEDLAVYLQSPSAPVDPQTQQLILNTDYTVTIPDPNPTFAGGYITLTDPAPSGYYLTLSQNVLATITTDFSNTQTINGPNLDAAFERCILLVQQLQTFNQQRSLAYPINTYLPSVGPTQVPTLDPGYIWYGGPDNNVISVQLEENPDVSTLRSELASELQVAPGTDLIGYYDSIHGQGQTLDTYLKSIAAAPNSPNDGGRLVGFYDNLTSAASSVTNALIRRSLYATDSSASANTITISVDASYTSYQAGDRLFVKVSTSNTGPVTININSIGSSAVNRDVGALVANELLNNQVYELVYNGSNWIVLNPSRALLGASVYLTASQTINSGVTAKILFDTVEYDPCSLFDATNNQFVVSRPGYYTIMAYAASNNFTAANNSVQGLIYKNGVAYRSNGNGWANTSIALSCGGTPIDLSLAVNDSLQFYVAPVGFNAQFNLFEHVYMQIKYIGN